MRRHNAILLAILATFLLIYTGFYYSLSRRGYAEADGWKMVGFHYLKPEHSAQWEILNYGCAIVFCPANLVDRALGTGRVPETEVYGLSRGGKK